MRGSDCKGLIGMELFFDLFFTPHEHGSMTPRYLFERLHNVSTYQLLVLVSPSEVPQPVLTIRSGAIEVHLQHSKYSDIFISVPQYPLLSNTAQIRPAGDHYEIKIKYSNPDLPSLDDDDERLPDIEVLNTIYCRFCGIELAGDPSKQSARSIRSVNSMPSEHWTELLEYWTCVCTREGLHNKLSRATQISRSVNGTALLTVPGRILVGPDSVVVHNDQIWKEHVLVEQELFAVPSHVINVPLTCACCASSVGTIDLPNREHFLFWKHMVRSTPIIPGSLELPANDVFAPNTSTRVTARHLATTARVKSVMRFILRSPDAAQVTRIRLVTWATRLADTCQTLARAVWLLYDTDYEGAAKWQQDFHCEVVDLTRVDYSLVQRVLHEHNHVLPESRRVLDKMHRSYLLY